MVVGVFLDFQWGEQVGDQAGKPIEFFPPYVAILALVVLGAGVCLLVPTSWLVGSGLLLGAAAASTEGLFTLVLYPMDEAGGFAVGYRALVAAHLVLLLAAGVAGVALARSGEAHIRRRAPTGQLPWLMILLGAAGAVALLFHVVRIATTVDYPGRWVAHSVWLTILVVTLPVVASAVMPPRLGAALLLGWVGGGAAVFVDFLAYANLQVSNGSFDIGRTSILLCGLTLLPLLVVGVLYARAGQAAPSHPAVPR